MCKLCETKPVYEFTNQRKLCKACYVKWFEKKFLYTIRKFKMIGSHDVIGYASKGGFREAVLEELLKMFARKSMVKLFKLPSKSNKVAETLTTDLQADKIVHVLIQGGGKAGSAVEGKVINPLYLFLDKEVLLYARLKKLKFKVVKEEKDNISKFIDELEIKHPEVKQAVVRSYLSS